MPTRKKFYRYLPNQISFISKEAAQIQTIYFPLCSPDSTGLKSAITPFLSGDIKTDKNHYLTKPTSREDLRRPVRNFFVSIKGKGFFSLAQVCTENNASVEMGPLWHKVTRRFPEIGLELEALNFIPASGETVELMRVTVKNISAKPVQFTPTGVIPIFGRPLSNKHDHEHVAALFHRIKQLPQGICVAPVMLFDEKSHSNQHKIYYVFGINGRGKNPQGTFPTVDAFFSDSGNDLCPEALVKNLKPKLLSDEERQGKEAVGALRFKDEVLKKGEMQTYWMAIGISDDENKAQKVFEQFNSQEKFDRALEYNKKFWFEKSHAIKFKTGDAQFNPWLQWITLQPVLRRIFGCSFLPDHDYGKGGRGWRDIWQDLLSLILIEPKTIRPTLINNFAGVRIDGTNATIIGSMLGEFIADRNAITRVWMDHGVWPFLTTLLYMNQTGDYEILFEKVPYFRDPQLSRTFEKDREWTPQYGRQLKDNKGHIYKGTILEHLLIQHLVQFFNVGEHNIIRLESADWNDGLDTAFKRGESVAFMSLYGGNLLTIADLLEFLAKNKGFNTIEVAKEILILLDTLGSKPCNYDSIDEKKNLLFQKYFKAVQPEVSGAKTAVAVDQLVLDLRKKGQWIFEHIRRHERVTVKESQETFSWFNGYYDNQGRRVEGKKDNGVWMTLTGQVFPIMSGLAGREEIKEVVKSVRKFLQDKKLGGYRLNTDFGVRHYLDLGRAFGFAYGHKENGAFFSHMTVMYAYGLYKRGFAREGFEVLRSIYNMCGDTAKSKIYPGIPEYFDATGRGMYHYLTGSASWLVLTYLTQVFGVRGDNGDLLLAPKLVKEEFGQDNTVEISCQFASKQLTVIYENKQKLDYGNYRIQQVFLNDSPLNIRPTPQGLKIDWEIIEKTTGSLVIKAILG